MSVMGTHSSLACVPATAQGSAQLLVKEAGIIAGVAFAQQVFAHVDAQLDVDVRINDGTAVAPGDGVGSKWFFTGHTKSRAFGIKCHATHVCCSH